MSVNPSRIKKLNDYRYESGAVIYLMSREQRINDNWSLLAAQEFAIENQAELIVVFCLVSSFLDASRRHFGFMLKGLEQTAMNLLLKNIPFILLKGEPDTEIPAFITKRNAGAVFTDFDPLRIKQGWINKISQKIQIPFFEVDSHNIVPCQTISQKLEWSAYTLRLKINKVLNEYLDEFHELEYHQFNPMSEHDNKISSLYSDNIENYSNSPDEISWLKSGESSAHKKLSEFIEKGINYYSEKRNNPNEKAQSDLSPYLHFGQISSQRIALELTKLRLENIDNLKLTESIDSFLEELIIRKELADNFCLFNTNYDNFEGFPSWAKITLHKHKNDKREFIYSTDEFEFCKTHDDLWNAAQREMIVKGKMHGYVRMYWAKKILEWSETPESAIQTAIYLNNNYELDGRDPNGYAGIAWSIGGTHDRPWTERPIFGMVRFMNLNGMKKKFDVDRYIKSNI